MSAPTSARTVITALVGNSFVMIIKLAAFLMSGSGSMLSEAIHSAADTGNQLLLFVGLRRGEKAPDDRFHYGYGGERFVFGILSAAGIFFIGCGITIYHGIHSLFAPSTPQLTASTFVVLGVSGLIEGSVLALAVRAILAERGNIAFLRYVRERADPATVAILLEDGAAVLGLLIATGGILMAYVTGNPIWDTAGSLIVGAILGGVAFYLVHENRELLLGRAVPANIEEIFTNVVLDHPAVRSVRDIKTRQLAHDSYMFKAELTLDTDYLAEQLDRVLPGDHRDLTKGRALRRTTIATTDLIATEMISVEAAIRQAIPHAKHIDLEIAHPEQAADDEMLA
ncbi:MAG: cation diffusion facilitator family transporter [Myxococcales bacterium]|nr:cation diffusion facilitator family transporter [Myxococcales bacterium]